VFQLLPTDAHTNAFQSLQRNIVIGDQTSAQATKSILAHSYIVCNRVYA